MRFAVVAMALLALAAPAFAQAGHEHHESVTGGGKLPAGWNARRDKQPANTALENVKFMAMGSGFHAMMGMTNATFWNLSNDAKGEFELTATFNQMKPNPMHPEGAGLVFNGANLDKPDQSYVYFLVRDGKYLINHRAGEEIHKIVQWTDHAAIKKQDATGKTSNKLSVRVAGKDVLYLVNDQVVHRQDREYMKPDGIVGLRINMGLDLHVENFQLKPLK